MNEIATLQPAEAGIPLSAVQLKARLATIQSVMREVMQKDADYGVIPGTDKPTLYKPGAEKLCVTFRLSAGAPMIEAVPEYTGDIRYRVQVPIVASDGTVLAVGVGECSTGEEKYRFRRPVHENEYNAAPEDQRREKWQRNGDVWRQVRVNPADVANTVLKMAHKRAYVHGVIMATAAGAIFTQDIEDLPDGMDGHADQRPAVKPPVQQPQRKERQAPAGAGTVARIKIKDIQKKQGTNDRGPWTKFTVIALDGRGYSTFDTAHADVARDAMASEAECEVGYTDGKYGRELQSIAIVAPAGDREPGDEQ